ncbi:hypothetical protein E2F48_14110 [Arthrobacter crusticola]|uniref:Uncharacterized protein n=1 Tax=Arthrobacter crusticola TaxID=2547960 RepID=A0A4R5TRV7_9MICC|nr:hypothetical protein [Arthrobacter crusticola]TDK23927.1 hypothetical protein E2F48_14110 [Arthrobacter crusticola]
MTLLDHVRINPCDTAAHHTNRYRPAAPLGGRYVTQAEPAPETEGTYVSTPSCLAPPQRGTYVTTSGPSGSTPGGYTFSN